MFYNIYAACCLSMYLSHVYRVLWFLWFMILWHYTGVPIKTILYEKFHIFGIMRDSLLYNISTYWLCAGGLKHNNSNSVTVIMACIVAHRFRYSQGMVLSYASLGRTSCRTLAAWPWTGWATSSWWSARCSEWSSSASRLERSCTSSASWRRWSFPTESPPATAVTRSTSPTISRTVSRSETTKLHS